MTPRRWWAVALGAFLLTTGCLGTPGAIRTPPTESPGSVQNAAPVVVLGLVDSGINPYHDQFSDPHATLPSNFLDATTGEPPIPLRLTRTGSFDERIAQDEPTWASIEKGKLYWFEGTRILGLSLIEDTPRLLQGRGHGTEVTSSVRSVSPETWVVMIELPPFPSRGQESTFAGLEKTTQGVEWLAAQPWVDGISLSRGIPGNPPPALWMGLVEASRGAVDAGKFFVAGAGNEPTPSFTEEPSGPPWVINVGGAMNTTGGEDTIASKLIDVVADSTRLTADREPDAYAHSYGTSFAAPAVAANLAQALLELRNATSHHPERPPGVLCSCDGADITAEDLRWALNMSATYWGPSDYRPLNHSAASTRDYLLGGATLPILPTPWVQMGWGYVGDDTWRTMVDILRGDATATKPAEAVQYMAAQQAAREAYWTAAS